MEYNHLEYVRKYFNFYYTTYYNRLSKNEVDSLCLNISKSLKNKYNDYKLIKSGIGDKFISSVVNSYVNKEHPQLRADYINMRNYINKYIKDTHFINYSIDTLDMITEGICDMLIHRYNYNKLNSGEFDEEITASYNVVLSGICDEIRNYVSSYVSNNVVPLTDINNVEVEDEVVKLLMNSDSINSLDLLIGRCDNIINDIAIKNREKNKNKRLSEMPNTVEYIKNVVEIYTEDKELVNKIATKVDMDLRDEGFNPNDIISGKYDMKIRKMFNDYYHKSRHLFIENSVEQEDVPSKIEVVVGKKNINKIIAELLVASALLGIISYGGYNVGKNIRKDKAMDNLKKFDSHSYNGVHSIYLDSFEYTAENIANTFDNYRNFNNDIFSYLGFYRAFNGSGDQKLYVMDNMMEQIRNNIYMKEEHSDLMNVLRSNGCYLDFIYDRLYDMGYTEIRDNKYYELLSSYMRVKKEHKYKDPVEYLSSSQQRLLNNVLRKYEELSEQYLLEFGVLLGDKNIVLEATSTVRRS